MVFFHIFSYLSSRSSITSHRRKICYVFLALTGLLLLSACGGGGGKSQDDTTVTLKGVVQKGPFTQLTVSAFPVNSAGVKGKGVTTNSSGSSFEIELPDTGLYQLEASGTYTNEVTGNEETLEQPLLSILEVNTETQTGNINLLTHLAAIQLLSHVAQGETVESALPEAEAFVEQTLGLEATTDFTQLDLTAITAESTMDDPDLQLLLLSAAVLQHAEVNNLPDLGGFITEFGSFETPSEATAEFIPISGSSGSSLYETVQPFFPQLPSALPALAQTQPVFICEPGSACNWQMFNTRTVSLLAETVLEADGEIDLTLQLSSASDQDIQVQLNSSAVSASAGIDFRPDEKIITIEAGQTQASTTFKLILDEADEAAETIQFDLTAIDNSYDIAVGRRLVTITDGFGTVVNGASTDVEVSSLCLSGLGDGLTIEGQGCADGSLSAIPDRDTAALAADLTLQNNCNSKDTSCDAQNKNWLVKLSLQSFDKNLGSIISEEDLGHYWFPGNKLHLPDETAKVETVFAHITPAFLQLLDDARQKNHTVRLAASLVETSQPVVVSDLEQPVLLPDTIIAGEHSLGYQLQSLSQNADCSGDHYLLNAEFSLDGRHDQPAELCVRVSTGSNNQIVGHLQDGQQLELAGTRIQLPAFHSSHIVYHDENPNFSRLQTLGADYFIMPSADDNGAALQQLCTDLDCFHGQGLTGEVEELSLYLHAEGLPFAFKIDSGYLDNQGIQLRYSARKYLHFGEYAQRDSRNFHSNEVPLVADAAKFLKSNDIIYRKTGSGLLQLSDSGINTHIDMPAGGGFHAFPDAVLIWQDFGFDIQNSKIAGLNTVQVTFGLRQTTRCEGCALLAQVRYSLSGDLFVNESGIALGDLNISGSAVPKWGVIDNQPVFQRPGDLSVNSSAMISLPGYIFDLPENVGIDSLLLGHVEQSADDLIINALTSPAAIEGNEWPTGITLGPQFYYSDNGEPVAGTGRLLNDFDLIINNGVDDAFTKSVNKGVKYVIRNSGITGVFNLDINPDLGDTMTIFDYQLNFKRFAFRLTDNTLDDKLSWVDGTIHLPGHADFDTEFTSLILGCDGKFDKGSVTYCADDSCQQNLNAWNANTDIFNMRFSSAAACVASDQQLILDQTVEMLALNNETGAIKPVGIVDAKWSPAGNILDSSLAPLQNMMLDRKPTHNGFAISPGSGQLSVLTNPADYGVLELKSTRLVAGQFWSAMQTDIRLANQDSAAAENSVVVAAGELEEIKAQRPEQGNTELAANLVSDGGYKQYSPDAYYDWKGLFDFSLPVYYTSGDSAAEQASFYGRYKKTDLVIMQAGAGIDYINADNTQLSFGVSAKIPEVGSLPIKLNLTDLASLKNIDNLLAGLSINLDLEQQFTVTIPLQPLLSDILDLGSNGILAATEEVLDEILKHSAERTIEGIDVNLWEEVAEPLVALQSIPLQLHAVFDAGISESFHTGVFEKSLNLREQLQALDEELTVNASVAVTDTNVTIPVLQYILRIKLILGDIQQENDRVLNDINRVADQALSLVDSVDGRINNQITRLNTAIDAITNNSTGILQQAFAVTELACRADTPVIDDVRFLKPGLDQVKNVERAIEELAKITQLIGIVSLLYTGEAELNQQLQQTLQTIEQEAEILKSDFEAGLDGLFEALCSSNDSDVYIQHALEHFESLRGQVEEVTENLNAIPPIIEQEINAAKIQLSTIQIYLSTLETILTDVEQQLVHPTGGFHLSLIHEQINHGISVFDTDAYDFRLYSDGTGGTVDFHTGLVVDLDTRLEALPQRVRELIPQINFSGAYFSADEYRALIIQGIMSSVGISELREGINRFLQSYIDDIMSTQLLISDQINLAIKAQLARVASPVNDLIAEATAQLPLPMEAAELNGSAIIEYNTLTNIHIQAIFSTPGQGEDVKGNTFEGAFDAYSHTANDGTENCDRTGIDALHAKISASGPISIGDSSQEASIGLEFTFNTAADGISTYLPIGLNGGITLKGPLDYDPFVLNDFAFEVGLGLDEVYLGAGGTGMFDTTELGLYAFVGRTCKSEVITRIDSQVADFISIQSPFSGLYARGNTVIPLVNYSCALNASASVDVGSWITVEPAGGFGGLLGGGLMGELACVGSLRGQVKTAASINTRGDIFFAGEAFAVAGAGPDCDAGTWTNIGRSRGDDWCGTADIRIGVKYEDEAWDVSPDSPTAIH